MGICTAEKNVHLCLCRIPRIGTRLKGRYCIIDVFSNSQFYRNIQRYGLDFYFPGPEYHIIGDSAFPIKT
ncbi:hypothetical protein NQ315_005643 [Exocentrus adspersus]|uniref:DDE Tnp4 domain-containing protein n=1 Tax=Exocentrus adspersus TaxID=1586481 RepID=A0AAV8V754_9CUCU|nr:hypothetical protein NQ315_005643 [Exocentrus adspersus]